MVQGCPPQVQMDEDEFVFKPAAAKQSSLNPGSPDLSKDNIPTVTDFKSSNSSDSFIAERKRQMDAELGKLGQERLEQFLNKEKEADRLREEEFASILQSPKCDSGASPALTEELRNETFEKRAEEIDTKEAEMFEEMREKAKGSWKELEEEFKASLVQLHQEQSARLVQESQLQESLKASGTIFNRELFEKVVEKCGKGKESAYAKEKMARFWEVLDRSHPASSSPDNNSKTDLDKDKLLASLLGINV